MTIYKPLDTYSTWTQLRCPPTLKSFSIFSLTSLRYFVILELEKKKAPKVTIYTGEAIVKNNATITPEKAPDLKTNKINM